MSDISGTHVHGKSGSMSVLGHVIALDPTVEPSIALARAVGTARFTFNWALAEYQRLYKAGGAYLQEARKRG